MVLLVVWTLLVLNIILPCVCLAFGASINTATGSNNYHYKPPPIIPITVLGGFLGTGKTTLLKNLLENSDGIKIAVIVNDVASVNIDSKLVSSMDLAAGMIELQSGCVCCSKSDELLASLADLITLNDMRGNDDVFDHIVVEMSGVADPKSVRAKFQEAELYGMPLLERVKLDTMVTLVDCSTFLDYLQSSKTATVDESPELFYRVGEEQQPDVDDDDVVPTGLLETLGISQQGEESGVADLIVSQVETADILILNKVDLADTECILNIKETVKALNPRANVVETTYGKISWKDVLGVAKGQGVVLAGVVDDHKDAVHAATCNDPDCIDPSHNHSHDHTTSTTDSTDLNSSSIDSSHSHNHEHACSDPDCEDTSHSHSHEHAVTHAGIGSFVYTSRRPFHPKRLLSFLRHMPVKRGLPEESDYGDYEIVVSDLAKSILSKVIRSKGFTWRADSHLAALYWSHAGCSFDLTCLGSWWATLPREQWPKEAEKAILSDFDSIDHNDQDASCMSVGDRRQEIVFIGPTLDSTICQEEITQTLNQCILNDDEWSKYIEIRGNEESLASSFPCSIEAKMVTF